MSFDEFALICTYLVITVSSQAMSGLSFFLIFLMYTVAAVQFTAVNRMPQNAQRYGTGLTRTPYCILYILGPLAGSRVTWATSLAKWTLQPRTA